MSSCRLTGCGRPAHTNDGQSSDFVPQATSPVWRRLDRTQPRIWLAAWAYCAAQVPSSAGEERRAKQRNIHLHQQSCTVHSLPPFAQRPFYLSLAWQLVAMEEGSALLQDHWARSEQCDGRTNDQCGRRKCGPKKTKRGYCSSARVCSVDDAAIAYSNRSIVQYSIGFM